VIERLSTAVRWFVVIPSLIMQTWAKVLPSKKAKAAKHPTIGALRTEATAVHASWTQNTDTLLTALQALAQGPAPSLNLGTSNGAKVPILRSGVGAANCASIGRYISPERV